MGRNIKKALKSVAGYAKSDKRTLSQLIVSIISLTMAVVVIVTMTFSWFSIKTSVLTAKNFTLDCGKGLRVNDTGTTELSYSDTKDKNIIPASSVDGRNLFFPTDGSDFSSNTESMTFRSANVGDKNVNYIQIDFTLTAQQNHTALYINDKKTSIRVADKKTLQEEDHSESDWSIPRAAALRSALWSSTAEAGVPNTPIVFNPTSSTLRTAAVQDVDRSTGAFISSGRQVAHAFSEYAYGGTPVATLSKGIETHFSYIIWLEGTDPKCTDSIIKAKDIEVKLAFSTSWDKTQTIRFEDATSAGDLGENNTVSSLINSGYSLSLRYDEVNSNNSITATNMEFTMYKVSDLTDNKIWSCNIPGDMRKNISFILRPPSSNSNGQIYKFTYDSKNSGNNSFDRGANRLYVAEEGPYTTGNYDTCQGYWKALGDSDGAGHDSGNLDGDDF